MSDFDALQSKVSNDSELRRAFNRDLLELLRRHGVDTDHPDLEGALLPDETGPRIARRCYGVAPQIIVCDDE